MPALAPTSTTSGLEVKSPCATVLVYETSPSIPEAARDDALLLLLWILRGPFFNDSVLLASFA
jgi:hypothetical protein